MKMNGVQPSMMPDPASIPLRDYHLPDPVSWWPPAIGWWGLAFFIIIVTVLVVALFKYQKKQQWRKDARRVLDSINRNFQEKQDQHTLAGELSIFIRRVCLTRFPNNPGASLSGNQWLSYLDSCTKTNQQLFHTDIGNQLITATYDPAHSINSERLIMICRQWLAALPSSPWRNK